MNHKWTLFRFLRVRDWYYFLPLILLAVRLDDLSPLRLAAGIALAAACLGYAYGWNNLKDASLDRSWEKNPLTGESAVPPTKVLAAILVGLAGGGLLCAAGLGTVVLLAVGVQLVGSTLYSGGPRLKGLPVVGTMTNIWIFAPICFFAADGPFPDGFWVFTGLFSLVLIQNQLIHEVVDIDEDRADGVRTTALLLGPTATWAAVVMLGLAGAVTIGYIGSRTEIFWAFALEALPLIGFTLWLPLAALRGRDPAALRRLQRGVGLLSGALVWATFYLWPLLGHGGGGA